MLKTLIYAADISALKNAAIYDELYNTAPLPRKSKIDAFKFDDGKRRSLGAWALLDKMLREIGINDGDKLNIEITEHGKPILTDYPDVHFNISHSKERVMCALSDAGIGCDTEGIAAADLKIAGRFYHKEEYDAILKAEDKRARDELFYRIWTRKESYIKALGTGLVTPMESFSVFSLPDEWECRNFDFSDGYSYACCAPVGRMADARFVKLM